MRKKFTIVICLLAFVVTALLLWPAARYDINRVYPGLRELAAPYQSVWTGEYLDGGSIGMTIVDRDGRRLQLALPISSGSQGSYPQLFVGATHSSKTGAVEVAFTEDTRRMLISTIEQYGSRADSSDLALVLLRGAPRDHARLYSHAAVAFCQRLVN